MATILDFNQPKLSKTEKAITMLQAEVEMLKSWNQGLQRQLGGLHIKLKISPNEFVLNTRKQDEITRFLEEAQKSEDLIMKAEQREKEEQAKNIEALTYKPDGPTKDDKNP
jgi:hypothetical protein